MSGWEKVAAATVLALIGLLGLNLAIWRRMRAATVAGRSAGQIQDERERMVEPLQIAVAQPADRITNAIPADQ